MKSNKGVAVSTLGICAVGFIVGHESDSYIWLPVFLIVVMVESFVWDYFSDLWDIPTKQKP